MATRADIAGVTKSKAMAKSTAPLPAPDDSDDDSESVRMLDLSKEDRANNIYVNSVYYGSTTSSALRKQPHKLAKQAAVNATAAAAPASAKKQRRIGGRR